MKKVLLWITILSLIFTLCACGKKSTGQTQNELAQNAATITGPVNVVFWHNYSGSLKDAFYEMVWQFNTTNELGITVECVYAGGGDMLSVIRENYNSGNIPNLVITGSGNTEIYAESGVLADLAPYVARDGFDMEDIPKSLRYYSEHYDGKIIQLPYLVNASITYYNKSYYPNGIPTDVEQWAAQAKSITEANPDVYGMGLPIDIGYTQRPFLHSLGSDGFTTADGTAAGCLEDGSLERIMTDWISWIDAGFCHPVGYKDDMVKALQEGKIASTTTSCVYGISSLSNTDIYGYAPCAGYGKIAGGLGGSGLCVLAKSTDQQIAACWEFIKFLYQEENILRTIEIGGYIPMTYSAAQSDAMQAFWAKYPAGKVAFEALDSATYNEWSVNLSKWREEIRVAFVDVVQNGTITPADAIAQLKRRAQTIFA